MTKKPSNFPDLLSPDSSKLSLFDEMIQLTVEGLQAGDDRTKFTMYQDDPVDFMAEVLRVKNIWDKLEEIAISVRDNQHTAVESANSVGKTFIAARIALWWLYCFPAIGDTKTKIITTAAPPERQIKELLWGEIKSAYRLATEQGAELLGKPPGAMHVTVNDSWWAKGFTIPMTGTREERIARFQGHHAEHLLLIFDESHGIPPEVYEAGESCMAGGHNHILLLSNPLSASGPFYDAIKDPKYNVINISAFDHPNVITGKNLIPGSITREKTLERIKSWSRPLYDGERVDISTFTVPEYFKGKYGGTVRKVTNPFLEVKTLGRVPTQADDSLIGISYIQRAQDRWVSMPPDDLEDTKGVAALDVAEFGADSNAWIIRKEYWVSEITRWNDVDPIQTGSRATVLARAADVNMVYVDRIGVGSGVAPHLASNDIPAHGIHIQERPTVESEDEKYRTIRDQMLWAIREWLINEPKAMLPPDKNLAQELAVLKYAPDVRGYIKVMNKEKIRKLIGRSPDALDALMLTFYVHRQWKSLKFVQV